MAAWLGRRALGLCSLSVVGACGGSGAGGNDMPGESAGDAGEDPGADCEGTPGRVGLQRLSRAEYNRTVRDLFGVTSAPADAFPPDSATSSFDNNAKSLTVSPQLAELLFDAAEDVAAQAMANMGGEIVTCDPSQGADCARTTLGALALRVYRRPATEGELDDLEALVQFAASEGKTFEASIEHALVAMLMSPQFLYRSVPAAGAAPLAPGQIVALDDYEVATRLSYFLWGSTPDDELLAHAAEGVLRERETLRSEFERMLADPKASALYEGFFRQWLQLGRLGAATPDVESFPEFSEQLRAEMAEETRLFFEGIRERDGSALEIITGTETYANEAIAALYGVPGPTGQWFVPIATDPTQRAGVLTMPAVLTMTSGPQAPNIVKRGVWLAEAILCAAPPPPPAAVPAEPVPQPGETERERLARHRFDPNCASCHDLIDPLGFAFESYDALGRWRDEIDGAPVDNLGKLPDGTTVAGVVEMAELLASGDDYPSCVTEKLMTYALGRTPTADDQCVVSAIAEATVTPDGTLSDLLWAVVTSDAFLVEEIEGDQ
jgi:hypothetical protein